MGLVTESDSPNRELGSGNECWVTAQVDGSSEDLCLHCHGNEAGTKNDFYGVLRSRGKRTETRGGGGSVREEAPKAVGTAPAVLAHPAPPGSPGSRAGATSQMARNESLLYMKCRGHLGLRAVDGANRRNHQKHRKQEADGSGNSEA